jgi:hypothetical protein
VRDFLPRKAKRAKIGGFRFARLPPLSGSHRAATKLDEPGLVQTPDVVVCRQDSLPRARPIETGAVIERQHSRDNRSDGRDFDLPRRREAILLRPRRGNAPAAGTHNAIWGRTHMRKVFFGAALAFACLAGTAASAGVIVEHGHSATSSGGGGWSGGYGVGGWKGNYSAKAATGQTSSVSFGTTSSATVGTTKGPVTFNLGRRDFARREVRDLRRDPECDIFVPINIDGARWRPGCKPGSTSAAYRR